MVFEDDSADSMSKGDEWSKLLRRELASLYREGFSREMDVLGKSPGTVILTLVAFEFFLTGDEHAHQQPSQGHDESWSGNPVQF